MGFTYGLRGSLKFFRVYSDLSKEKASSWQEVEINAIS